MDLLSLFQLLVIMNWFFFSFFSGYKKKMLLIAIVSLQFILLQYSCAPFVNGRRVLQKTQVMNCGHAKIMSYEPHMQTQSDKTFNLPLCTQ